MEHGDGGPRGVHESFALSDERIQDDELQSGMVDGPCNAVLEASLDAGLYFQGLGHGVQVPAPRVVIAKPHVDIDVTDFGDVVQRRFPSLDGRALEIQAANLIRGNQRQQLVSNTRRQTPHFRAQLIAVGKAGVPFRRRLAHDNSTAGADNNPRD